MTILCSLRFENPKPGRPGPRIYIPHEQRGPALSPGTVFPFRRLLRLAGLCWRYSNPPPPISFLYSPGTDRTGNVSATIVCSLFAGVTTVNQSFTLRNGCLHSCYLATVCMLKYMYIYCDVLASNASNNLWILDFISPFIGYTPSGIYNYLLQSQSYCKHTALILHRLTSRILLPLLFTLN
jgi:hypothetical protein